MTAPRCRKAAIAALAVAAALAAPPSAALSSTAQVEIDSLLAALRTSGCGFERNGAWHQGEAAARHLERKRDHFLKRSEIHSAEDFIRLAASGSSVSGQAYRVRCGDGPAISSADWLRLRLKALRSRAR